MQHFVISQDLKWPVDPKMQNSRYESFAKKFEIEAFFHRPTI